ncbi:pyridoxal phosphate-dependent aminotransferase, partial [Candidatus Hydrogenedentota bacterium]
MNTPHSLRPVRPAVRVSEITYGIRDIVVFAHEVAESGKDMMYLNIGNPNEFDFWTPRHIIEATYQAMLENKTGYAPSTGIDEALDAIGREAKRNGIESVQSIFLGHGGSEVIDNSLSALLDDGDNVLTPCPCYSLYTAILARLGAEARMYYLDEEDGWQPDLDDIASKIDSRTKAIVLINPGNPTGSVCSRKTLETIAQIAHEKNVVVISDETYDKLILDD